MAHTRTWEEEHPAGTEDVSLGDDRIRNLKIDLGERLEDLLYGFNISDGTGDEVTPGVKVLNFKEQASIATPSANQINIAAKVGVDGDAKAQFWAKDEDGNERQLTKTSGSELRLNVKAGDYAADSIDENDIRLNNNGYMTGRNQAGDGDVNIIKVNTSNVPEILVGAVLSAETAPTSNPAIANKKYVDDHVGHDGDGYILRDIDGTPTKVYTKYLTGNLDADSSTSVAHGCTASKILSVSGIAYNDATSRYQVSDVHKYTALSTDEIYGMLVEYDTTNIIISNVGTNLQGNAYRIKIDYYL